MEVNLLKLLSILLLAAVAGCDRGTQAADTPDATDRDGFATFISPGELQGLDDVVIVDARSPEEYAAGHIPGAINLPGESLRTPKADPGEGDSQYLFAGANGSVDVARYERLLGEAGLTPEADVVVYGNHAGQADGSVAAMLLDALGHRGSVRFLDGVGLSEWRDAGLPVETTPSVLSTATYRADLADDFVWSTDDVLARVNSGDTDVVFYDTRSPAEYAGIELRKNAHGGHVPGAVSADYSELLNEDKTVKPRAEIEAIFAEQGLPEARAAGRPIVLYCQTSTRVSLPYLLLRELGYDDLHIYDASWHDYGNRDDTPIER